MPRETTILTINCQSYVPACCACKVVTLSMQADPLLTSKGKVTAHKLMNASGMPLRGWLGSLHCTKNPIT